MGISQKAEDDVLISSKAKRKDERGTLDKEISSIFNHIYGNNSYRNRFSKLELNQIVSYYGEIKEIVNPNGDPQYNTSEIKGFLKKKRDTSQYRVKDPYNRSP